MDLITRPTKVTLEGKGALTLRQNDYVTQGGEGALYRRGEYMIKLYLDPAKMQRDGMAQKVHLLRSRLTHPSVVAPKGVVFDDARREIGFYMPHATGEALPLLATSNFWQQTGWGALSVVSLADRMREVVVATHQAKVLMVDGNELNWLADIRELTEPVPYAIDVDSWQIDRFRASVIMPSIRDWHAAGFSEVTDWFAWGVVTFVLFTGIHPYRGTLAGYKNGAIEERMKNNASVFLPGVRLSHAVRDFGLIPAPLCEWYRATFTEGVRTPPPSPRLTGAASRYARTVRMVTTAGSGGLVFEKLFDGHGDALVAVWPSGLVQTKKGRLLTAKTGDEIAILTGSAVFVVGQGDGWLIAEKMSSTWRWRYVDRVGKETVLSLTLAITGVWASGERMFVLTESELVEVGVTHFAKPLLLVGRRWPLLPQATQWFRGLGISNVLGASYLVLPHGTDAVLLLRVPELDRKRVVAAYAGNHIALVVTLERSGDYVRHTLILSRDGNGYRHEAHSVDSPELNVTALPKGVVAAVYEDGQLTISVPSTGVVRTIADRHLTTDRNLARIADQVVYVNDDTLWSVRTQ